MNCCNIRLLDRVECVKPLSRSRFAGFDARRAPAGLAAGGRSRRQRAIAGQSVSSLSVVVDENTVRFDLSHVKVT